MASFTEYAAEYSKNKKKKKKNEQTVTVSNQTESKQSNSTKQDNSNKKQSFTEYATNYANSKKSNVVAPTKNDIAPVKETEKTTDKGNFLKWLGYEAVLGIANFNKVLTATADLIIGKPLNAVGLLNNPINQAADYYAKDYANWKRLADAEAQKLGGGKGYEYGGDLLEGTVAAAPNAILALLTQGTSLGATSTTLATNAAYETGNILTKVGLTTQQMAQNPQFWLSFAQTYGNDYEEAKENGADETTAILTATVTSLANAGIEIGIDGASGIQGLPNKLLKGNKAETKAVTEWIKSSIEEGEEEVIQGFISDIVAKVTYDKDREVADSKKMAQEFAMGTAIGGALGGGQVGVQEVSRIAQIHEASKLTQTEQAVVDKVVENRIAEAEKDGKKLTNAEKKTITETVKKDLEKGNISIDTIEEVLGGETYSNYKSALEQEENLQKEFNTLNKMKQFDMTGEQIDRRAELKQQLEELKNNSNSAQLKAQLKEEVYGLAKDSRLAESYNEETRKTQAFKADLTQYNEKQRKAVERAINSGVLNNTNKSHALVNTLSKIEAEKGIVFDYTNNEKLKKSGFAIEGKTVNGFVQNGNVTLNVQSSKTWQSVVGHEITHVLEGTDAYSELQRVLFEVAESKGELDSRRAKLTELYKNMDADIDAELTADLVGDYLFGNKDFINKLTGNKRTFRAVYNEIKYLCKVATGKQLTEIEKVRQEFDKAWKELSDKGIDTVVENAKAKGKTQLSVSETTDGRIVAVVDSDILGKIDTKSWDNTKKEAAKKAASNALKQFSDGIVVDGITRKVNRVSRREYTRSNDTEKLYRNAPNIFADKMRAADIADDIVVAATDWNRDGYLKHLRDDNFVDFDHGTTLIMSGNAQYIAEVVVGITKKGEAVLYDVVDMTPTTFEIKEAETSTTATTQNAIGDIQEISATNSIPNNSENVNRQYLLSETNDATSDTNNTRFSLSESNNTLEKVEKTLYNKNSPLSIVDRASKNNKSSINWVYKAEIFSVKENMLFHEMISEINQGSQAFGKNSIDEYMLPIGNKIVFTDGNYDSPYVREVIEILTESQTEFEDIKECVFSVEKGESTKHETARYVQNTFGEGRVISYTSRNNGVYGWENGRRKGKTRRTVVKNYLNKLYGRGNDSQINETTADLNGSASFMPENVAPVDTKFSVSADSQGRELSAEQQDYFALAKTRDEQGKLKPFYHGTSRADRVGNVFRADRATSGPMAFFTDNQEIADNYSRDKKDTSIAYDSEYDSYETQFRVNRNGKNISVVELWNTLPTSERNAIKEKAKHITMDEDWENVIYSEDAQYGLGNFDAYELNAHKGNALHTLVDSWLTDGNIYGEEQKFLDVLKLVGIDDAQYMNPDYREEKTYAVYLNITNPFDTSNVSAEMLEAFKEAAENVDFVEGNSADMWDKRNIPPEKWIERLEYDIENGTTHCWTSIPDFVTDVLKAHGYDGIFDTGGKNGGTSHTVAIPFYSEQIKNVDNANPTDNPDIRKSLSNVGEQPSPIGTPLKELAFEQDIAPVRDDVNYQNQGINVSQEFPVVNKESENSDIHSPSQDDIAPIREDWAKNKTARVDKGNGVVNERIAKVLTEVPKAPKEKSDTLSSAVRNFVSKGAEIENIALEKGNRELQAKYSAIRRAEAKAQYFMENGAEGVKPLKEIIAEVEKTGQTGEFFDYLYHKHNVDRMSLESKEQPNLKRLEGEMKKLKLLHLQENQLRAIASEKITKETSPKRVNLLKTVREYLASKDVKNKPVFGYFVTAEISQETANQYEANNPKFKEYAKDIYNLMNYLRSELVENGVISQKTADLWAKVYPYYVPIHRVDANGAAVNVALDTNKTGINAPIKRATGGNSDILPLFNTIGERVIQTYKAIAKNQFGIELKNTLGTVAETSNTNLDDIIDSIDTQDNLLQEGKNGQNPTFTIFENGEKVTFDINEGIYEALKPTSKGLSKTYKLPNKASELHKKVLTQYNLFFTARNFPKDAQSVMINSQHPIKTYANFPSAFKQLLTNGEYATEYFKNGGKSLTYFDKNKNEFVKEKNTFKKVLGFAPDKISDINDFVEAIPRLAEYMASRKSGKTIDGALLDASRVTTDFSDGGDITKFLNRNGFTFLNASVQGAAQQVRNIREAKANGFKGIMKLVGKYAVAGIPALLFNAMMWDDDEEYEELSDYVKDNYYIVAKYGDGQFVRIPKGREAAVIQELFEQIGNTVTGEETDWGNVFTLAASNLAPNNPLENNVVAPIIQAINNKTWYDDDLVPTRLQDLPADEQYDETIDSISKWLGENTGISPYKINYVLNQYSGFIGDMILPNLTPEAEKGDNSLLGNMIAPLIDQFTVDGTMKNQNVSDFYEKVDELTTNAKSSKATDADKLKYKYFNSISTEVGELYNEKREIQGSDLSDKLKYKQVRDIQKQINELTENALNTYEDVKIDGKYANIGDRHYYLNKDNEWQKITDEQLEKQNKAINILGISAGQYWGNKSEYDMAAFSPEKYAVLKEQGISVEDYKENYEETAFMYTDDFSWATNNPEKYTLSKVVTDDVAEYKKFTTDLYNIKADKDSSGKSISGSRKEKVEDYINNLDIGYGAKIILFKCEYPSDETYDYDIIKYLKGREDISYSEKKTILEELGFKVDENGNIFRK